MQTTYYTSLLASTYGSSQYNTDVYNGSTRTGTGSGGSNGDSLTNTGIAIASVVTLAAVILLVAMVVRIWKRPSKKADSSDG